MNKLHPLHQLHKPSKLGYCPQCRELETHKDSTVCPGCKGECNLPVLRKGHVTLMPCPVCKGTGSIEQTGAFVGAIERQDGEIVAIHTPEGRVPAEVAPVAKFKGQVQGNDLVGSDLSLVEAFKSAQPTPETTDPYEEAKKAFPYFGKVVEINATIDTDPIDEALAYLFASQTLVTGTSIIDEQAIRKTKALLNTEIARQVADGIIDELEYLDIKLPNNAVITAELERLRKGKT